MAGINLHSKPFDEGTIAKLEIFEAYTEAWLPVFLVLRNANEIHIFDFFSGTGYDLNKVPGSPIRILNKIFSFEKLIKESKTRIILHLNEYDSKKAAQLQSSCEEYLKLNDSLSNFLKVKFYQENFEALFSKLLPVIGNYPSLVFLDQNGIKYASVEYIKKLTSTRTTDFLLFISSSYLWRFKDHPNFTNHIHLDSEKIKKAGFMNVHKSVTEQLSEKLLANSKYSLYPFSIKKGAGAIYGIIFGSSNELAVDKFLNIGWRIDRISGSANYDIGEDISKAQLTMFEPKKLTKKEQFYENVKELILSNKIRNNKELLLYTYSQGHIPAHARECINNMKKEKLIHFDGTYPLVNYDQVFKKGKILNYSLKVK